MSMPGTGVGLFVIDFLIRPFAKIWEKMPTVMLVLCIILYAIIGYAVLKSAWLADQHN
jgi:hypothetical protein